MDPDKGFLKWNNVLQIVINNENRQLGSIAAFVEPKRRAPQQRHTGEVHGYEH